MTIAGAPPLSTSQIYVYEFVPDTGVIITLVTTPVIEIVGVAVIASVKAAVIVTVSDPDSRLSVSVSAKITVTEVWADRLKLTNKNNI